MSRLNDWLDQIQKQGYSGANANARICQDIVLEAIAKGKLRRNVTIKGGVVMRSLTGDVRRAIQDMDIDFIRYSLADDSIQKFIQELNVFDDIHIEITGTIEPLKHQDYHGKCVNIRIYDDEGFSINSKIDFGVHKDLTIQQEEYCFDVCMDEDGASLLMNSREQMMTEKLRSLLKFGPASTHYKDISYPIAYAKSRHRLSIPRLKSWAFRRFFVRTQTSHITNTVHMRPAKGFRGNKKA